jgi:hypothetical protein
MTYPILTWNNYLNLLLSQIWHTGSNNPAAGIILWIIPCHVYSRLSFAEIQFCACICVISFICCDPVWFRPILAQKYFRLLNHNNSLYIYWYHKDMQCLLVVVSALDVVLSPSALSIIAAHTATAIVSTRSPRSLFISPNYYTEQSAE